MNFLKKLIFLIKKPPVILITGKGRSCAIEAIFQLLKPYSEKGEPRNRASSLRGKFLIFESDLSGAEEAEKFSFFLKKSKLPILVVTHIGEIMPDKDFFAGEREETLLIRNLAKVLPSYGYLILNFDDETVREIKNESSAHPLTYGFQERADFKASDININLSGTNFKINYQGNIVPFWLKNIFGKEQIYSVLTAIAVGVINNRNLVEISQALSGYQSIPGKMRLIKGKNNSLILDDSENATPFSMIEALDILGKIEAVGRRIAVLGDVLGFGRYIIEAHETVGERAAKACNLLFTVGQKAQFIALGAKNKGMPEQNIFQLSNIEEAKQALQKEIKENDLILVDGSKEMKMGEIVGGIKA